MVLKPLMNMHEYLRTNDGEAREKSARLYLTVSNNFMRHLREMNT